MKSDHVFCCSRQGFGMWSMKITFVPIFVKAKEENKEGESNQG